MSQKRKIKNIYNYLIISIVNYLLVSFVCVGSILGRGTTCLCPYSSFLMMALVPVRRLP